MLVSKDVLQRGKLASRFCRYERKFASRVSRIPYMCMYSIYTLLINTDLNMIRLPIQKS